MNSRTVAGRLAGLLALLAAGLGTVYLLVACKSLPGALGGVPGDNHPRTKLGEIVIGLAVGLSVVAYLALRRSNSSSR